MSESTQSLIRLDGIKKVFLTDEVETHALSGIHMDIRQGEYVAISGPSGCGKSTLLAILGLLDSPSDGKYWLNGQEVADLPMSQRARVQDPPSRGPAAQRRAPAPERPVQPEQGAVFFS